MSDENVRGKEVLEQQIALVEYMVKTGNCDGIGCSGGHGGLFKGVPCPYMADHRTSFVDHHPACPEGNGPDINECRKWLRENRPSVKSETLNQEMMSEQQIALVDDMIKTGNCHNISCEGFGGVFSGVECPFMDNDLCIETENSYTLEDCVEWIRRHKQSNQTTSAHSEGSRSNENGPGQDQNNTGGSTPSQYALPEGAAELQDLIEHREMNFQVGNIFKACYRMGHCAHSDRERDLRKILYFAERELNRVTGDSNKAYTE